MWFNGGASELQSELYVALDQEYISRSEFDEFYSLAGKARSKTRAFIKYLKQSTRNQERSTTNKAHGAKHNE